MAAMLIAVALCGPTALPPPAECLSPTLPIHPHAELAW